MIQKLAVAATLWCLLVVSVGCGSGVQPSNSVKAESPDRGLFDHGMKAVRNSRPEEARTLLETLINTYPDSEYVTRAKSALDDIWYAEGGIGPRQESVGAGGNMTFFPPLREAPVEIPKVTNSRTKNL